MVDFRDFGIEQLKADLKSLAGTKVTIGWQGKSGKQKHPNADVPVAKVAAFNEYGTKHSLARPGLQVTFQRHGEEIKEQVKRAVADLVDGRRLRDQIIEDLGKFAVSKLRMTLDDSRRWAAELAESTILRKGHDQPLIDTKVMYKAASWAERRGGSIKRQGGEQ
jgi:hypothetical protein